MKKLNQTELKKYRRALEALGSRVRSDASGMVEQVRSGTGGNGGSELSNAPFHLGDMGTDEFLYDMNATLLANEQYIVAEARQALERMDRGAYGICEACGQAIAKARLEAIPFTRFCVECAEKNPTPEVNFDEGRPHSPKDTFAPEGEMGEDRPARVDPLEFPPPPIHGRGDVHAAGTAGGGTAVGGLAGGNEGDGDPVVSELDEATASGHFDAEDDRADDRTPLSGRSGGAVGGTPARKRAR